jgi:RNA polymerase-associated protein LEO1
MLGQECFDCNLTKLGDQYQYLYLRDPQSTVLQARTKLQQSMVMRPYGTGSRTHKKLTATVLQRHKKTTKTKSYSLIADPEAAKQQAERVSFNYLFVLFVLMNLLLKVGTRKNTEP